VIALTNDIRDLVATRVATAPTFLVERGGMNAAGSVLDAFAGASEH
jgi:hypothetical protein